MEADADADQPVQSSFIRIFGALVAGLIGLSFVMTNMSRKAVMAAWANRRCDVGVMFSGFLYKPDDYGGSAMDFASENFDFCMKFLAGQAIGAATNPAINIMGEQAKAGGVIQEMLNSIRGLIAKLVNSFSSVLQGFYETYRRGMLQFARVWQALQSMMSRVEASVVATMYAFLSGYTGILNTVDFIIKIAIVMLNVISSMFILMFFTFLPFLPVLIGTVNVITSAGYGEKVKGPAAIFCFARGSLVHGPQGTLKPIEQLQIGDELEGGGVVEGMFTFDGRDSKLYLLDDVLVSGTHLVYGTDGIVRPVADDPRSRATEIVSPILYCPILSNRTLIVGRNGVKFADWEEVSGPAEDLYDAEVRRILQGPAPKATLPPGFKQLGCAITTRESGIMCISKVRIGEHVLDQGDSYTRILGTVRRRVSVDRRAIYTDGVIGAVKDGWTDALDGSMHQGDSLMIDIYHIITDSGTFAIQTDDSYEWMIVRDATEISHRRLDSLTQLVLEQLNSSTNIPA